MEILNTFYRTLTVFLDCLNQLEMNYFLFLGSSKIKFRTISIKLPEVIRYLVALKNNHTANVSLYFLFARMFRF